MASYHDSASSFGASEKHPVRSTSTSRGSHRADGGGAAADPEGDGGWPGGGAGGPFFSRRIGHRSSRKILVESAPFARFSSRRQVGHTVGRGHHEHRRGLRPAIQSEQAGQHPLAGSPSLRLSAPEALVKSHRSRARRVPSLRPGGFTWSAVRASLAPPDRQNSRTHIQAAAGACPLGNRLGCQ